MIFVDTSFWVALLDRRDDYHASARELLRGRGSAELVTSNTVRGETWTFLRRRLGHHAAVAFLTHLDRSKSVELTFITPELEKDALRWLRRHDEREYSFIDATSFAYMRSSKVREALAFDGDFSAAGFVELR